MVPKNQSIQKIIHRRKKIRFIRVFTPVAILVLISILLIRQASSQEFDFIKITSQEISNFGFVTGIAQAPNGIMWFSTKNGLHSYDGQTITAFNPDPANPNSISSNALESIAVDSSGFIWVGTLGQGLNRFDPKTRSFTHYRYDPTNPEGLSNDTVTKILCDQEGILWIGTHNGLDKYVPETDQFRHYQFDPDDPNSLSFNQVRSLLLDSKGVLWVGTGSPYPDNGGKREEGGLNRMNKESGTFTRFMNLPGDSLGLMNNKISSIYEDSKGTFWVGTAQNSLHIFNREKGTFKRQHFDATKPWKISGPAITSDIPFYYNITFITEDISGNLWVGTSDLGVLCFPANKKERYHFEMNQNSNTNFTDLGAWESYTSRDGVFWIGGTSGNIYRINPLGKKIPHFNTPSSVNDMYETPGGDLWIATNEKIIVKEQGNNTLISKKIDVTPENKFDDFVRVIVEDHQGNIWVGGNWGLNVWDDQNDRLISFRNEPGNKTSLSHNAIITIYEDREQNLWIGTNNGLNLMDKQSGTFRRFYMNRNDTSLYSINTTTSVLQDKQGNLRIGIWSGGGVHHFDPEQYTSKQYLSGLNIVCLFEDSFGTIWAGTSDGLFRYNYESDRYDRFIDLSTMNGYFVVNTILEDDQHYLWVSTNDGILRINPQRDVVNRLGKAYGIDAIDFNWNSSYKGRNGNLYFGHTDGYFMLDPNEIPPHSKQPEIVILAFQIANQLKSSGNQNLGTGDFQNQETIRLRSDQNMFSIDYAIIDYSNPEDNQLLYFLENYDNNWQLANSEGRTYYFNVPPGKYVFRVRGMNSFGLWAEKKIKITILPPWWLTWWAYGLYAIVFGLLVFGFDRFQRRRIKMKERQRSLKKELAQAKEIEKAYTDLKATQNQLIQAEKMASLGELTAGIAHEIQNPLNFVNNFSEVNSELIDELDEEIDKGDLEEIRLIAKDIAQNEQKIIHHGRRADAIVKNMLQHSRGSGEEKIPTDINALADEYLRLSYHGLRAKDKTFNADFKTELDPAVPKVKVVPQDIGRVLLNIINNAFHACAERSRSAVPEKVKSENGTYKPLVIVTTVKDKDQVVISVKDNGSGIPDNIREKIFQPFFTTKPSGEGTGLGLSLSFDIVTKGHGGRLDLKTKEGEGTEFIIQLPVNK